MRDTITVGALTAATALAAVLLVAVERVTVVPSRVQLIASVPEGKILTLQTAVLLLLGLLLDALQAYWQRRGSYWLETGAGLALSDLSAVFEEKPMRFKPRQLDPKGASGGRTILSSKTRASLSDRFYDRISKGKGRVIRNSLIS